ncbi:MAG: TrmH family RNA methyltransferase [Flavobacteriales bacterium]
MHEKKSMSALGRLSVEEFKSAPKIPLWIVLDNIRSGLNVGGIFRTADAFSAEAVYCCGYTPSPPHREVLKSALGATETVKFEAFSTTLEAIQSLRGQGIKCYAVEQTTGSLELISFAVNQGDKLAFVFGNEVHGVDQEVINACDGAIEIGQTGTKHSLNVSVCAGILIHHLSFRFQSLKM